MIAERRERNTRARLASAAKRLERRFPDKRAVIAVENLYSAGVEVQPALMASFSAQESIEALRRTLPSIAPPLGDLEIEDLVL